LLQLDLEGIGRGESGIEDVSALEVALEGHAANGYDPPKSGLDLL
jgi:hypothetical protein